MLVGKLQTRILEQEVDGQTEGGFFELDVEVNERLLQTSGVAAKDFLSKHIALHLTLAVKSTTVPAEYWTFTTSDRVVRRYEFPQYLNFGVL